MNENLGKDTSTCARCKVAFEHDGELLYKYCPSCLHEKAMSHIVTMEENGRWSRGTGSEI